MSELTLEELQKKLEEMFAYTSDMALGKIDKMVPDVRIAAAEASAHIAGMLIGIQQINLMLGIPPDLDDPDGLDLGEDGPEGFDPEVWEH